MKMILSDFEKLIVTGKTPKNCQPKKEKGYRFNKTDRTELIKRQLAKEKG